MHESLLVKNTYFFVLTHLEAQIYDKKYKKLQLN